MEEFELVIDGNLVKDFSLYTILGTIEDFEDERDKYIILRPNSPIKGSIYMQASVFLKRMTDPRNYVIEIRLEDENGFRHFRHCTKQLEEIRNYFREYYEDKQVPNLSKWEDITNLF